MRASPKPMKQPGATQPDTPGTPIEPNSAYAAAGVDVAAGERAVELMRTHVERTRRPEVLGSIGGFAGLFDASALTGYQHPVLATSTDGVGTKIAVAKAMGRHDTIGRDLVGMLVDDIVVCGAQPLFLTDYIACGHVVPERIAEIVSGIADGCVQAGCALIGGETAEHPGLMAPDDYDLAGATVGVVEQDKLLGAQRVRPDDVVLAMASSGLHSNGYSLVRRVLLDWAGLSLDADLPELDASLGEELLTPTRIYAADVLGLLDAVEVHALSHITGGGLAGNLARVIPDGLHADIDRATWTPLGIFRLVRRIGSVSQPDMEAALNMGVGMVAVLPADQADAAQRYLDQRALPAWVCGRVNVTAESSATARTLGPTKVTLHGEHPLV